MSNELEIRKTSMDVFTDEGLNAMIATAQKFAAAGALPQDLRKNPANVLIIMQTGREMGLPPMQAIMGIDIIRGRIAVKPKTLLGMVQKALPNSYIKYDVKKDSVTVTGWRDYKNNKDQSYSCTWDLARAKQMGLSSKDNWIKQPQTMLKWRAVGDVLSTIFSDVTLGIITSDEAIDIEPSPLEKAEIKIADKKNDIEINEKLLKKEKVDDEQDIGEFVITVGSLEGKKLKEIDISELLEFYTNAKGHFDGGKVPMSQKEKVLLNVLEMYLTEKELLDSN